MNETSLLFAEPSFVLGMAAVMDIGATLTRYNESETPELADYRAIRADWLAVGKDIASAINEYEINYVQEA